MSLRLSGWDDTIVALATPPGVGALGIIRLSGLKSFSIANELFPSRDLFLQPSHTLHVGFIKYQDEVLDEAVVSLFRAPKSYTGEDVVEISCHGSPFVQEQVIHACILLGARMAKPGEFTQRAFLKGRLDLAQAEAVADLIASNTSASQRTALNNIRGGFSHTLKMLREQLLTFSSLIELELDFSEEDVIFADRERLEDLVKKAAGDTGGLLNSFRLGNVIRNGVSVAIVGKPNAGKSTLLNELLNEDRAIVSEIPGTTRDTVEEVLNIDGILFRLIDTAGLRAHSEDTIENVGMEKSRQKMQQADIILYLFDVNEVSCAELKLILNDIPANANLLLVGNKMDLSIENKSWEGLPVPVIFISALKHKGLDNLKEAMVQLMIKDKVQTEQVIVTNARHYYALQKVAECLDDIEAGLKNNISGDLLSSDIRRCMQYLGEITGEVTNEDQLDYIFSKFCIGK